MEVLSRPQRAALLVLAGVAAALLVLFAAPPPASAEPPPGGGNDTREIDKDLRNIGPGRVKLADENGLPPKARGDENRVPQVGDQRIWLALDDFDGSYYLKVFTLRAVSKGGEVWVANNLNFPAGDCRNDGIRNVVTNEQMAYMLRQFDKVIRPTDVAWFGEPVARTGRDAQLDDLLKLPATTYRNNQARDVILVDNVRDDNFYDTNNANSLPYIAGFFTTAMPYYHDRNVITIDSWDWIHRTGDDPLHEPSADPCTSAPARPNLYEGVFAHEYQHLIHSDYDADELNWVNEGMSDLAEILTGYSDPSLHVDEKGYDSHTQSFLGWNAVANPEWNPIPRPAGPENSLTLWGDQGPLEILADYGHAFFFMTYLFEHGFGQDFFTTWAHEPANGIEGLNNALAAAGSSETYASLFAKVQLSALTDAFVDAGATVSGATAADASNSGANATIHFTSDAYATPGAPPWGSDYVPLGPGSALTSVAFDGDEQFVFPSGPQWTTSGDYYVVPTSDGHYAPNQDISITHAVSGGGTLTFNHYVDTEVSWDFGFVQVSTDSGATWTSVACTGTTSEHDPGAVPAVQANVPGYTGTIGSAAAPVAASCDLPAGTQLIAFRFVSDPAVQQGGWGVKDVQLNGVAVGTNGDLTGWSNQKFFAPAPLDFEVTLVGLTGDVDTYGHVTNATSVVVVHATLDAANDYTFSAGQLSQLAGSDEVVAIVTGVPEAEDIGVYAPYSLLVNGAERADGAGVTNPW